jgi:putative hydrolase of the HAD superfamily
VNPKAVIFDYYGTLTVATAAAARRAGADRVAAELGVPADLHFATLSSTFTERSTGQCGDMRATMSWVADRCGRHPSDAQLDAACRVRSEIEGGYARMVREDTVDVLRHLRDQGLRVGVVSDCTHELPELWETLPVAPWVDATVFSVVTGCRKPHPSMYTAACTLLGITPSEGVYVGDGGSNELSGARSVGMPAARLLAEDADGALVYDREQGWTGPVIGSLTALTSGTLSSVFGHQDEDQDRH